ncbi:hybrid sensor histidine kinase/response regulator [Streptomyces sp. Tu6071]|uniref:hybrid sensor histidine kinase/response regulator n=1 Tax=Streptomyces sp. Tu6071 TaxID=355249 RepID=UPI0002DEFE83|nr:hybrid sensor histidine kinase/response regulator [Streptomyces sp. Tu6071]
MSPAAHDLLELRLREPGDVHVLRRCAQTACRAAGISGSALVRLTTVASEAGEQLLGATGLTARLRLEDIGPHGGAALSVHFGWGDGPSPTSALLSAAARLLDRGTYRAPEATTGTGDATTARTESPARTSPRPPGAPAHALLLAQFLPGHAACSDGLADEVRTALAVPGTAADLIETLRTQNRQLLAALDESQQQGEELRRLNGELEETNAGVLALYRELAGELEETNSGVVALYAELEEKNQELELVQAYRARFWANVSHELRTPVNSVIALAQLLLDPAGDPLSEEQSQQVSLMRASGSTLLALVDELLDVAKAESGRLEPLVADVDLRPLLHQLRGTLRGTAHPEVTLHVPDHRQSSALHTDEVMLTRVLRNILSNALKFTRTGHVRLEIEEHGTDADARFVFRVTDTGVGIPEPEIDRVFEEFYQVRGPHQRGRAGTGLGLPYARRLTQLLGGSLTLSSTLGKGTVVVIDLPARHDRDRAPLATTAPGTSPERALRSVVVVDDDAVFVNTLRPMLARLSENVIHVADSSRAVGVIAREQPDAVFLDLTMPGKDGYTVHAECAAHPAVRHIPVLVLTSLAAEDVDRGRLPGAHTVLHKTRLTLRTLTEALAPSPSRPAPAGDPRKTPQR